MNKNIITKNLLSPKSVNFTKNIGFTLTKKGQPPKLIWELSSIRVCTNIIKNLLNAIYLKRIFKIFFSGRFGDELYDFI